MASTGCPSCGRPHGSDDAYCAVCGAQLHGSNEWTLTRVSAMTAAARCTSCNNPLGDDASFCVYCGAPSTGGTRERVTRDVADLETRVESVIGESYQVLRHLGSGGMGSVFLALQRSLNQHVAIKVMAPRAVQSPNAEERFRAEALTVARLRHDNIVGVRDFQVRDGLHYFVMDYVEGATLRQIIRGHGPLPVEAVRSILYDVGSALQHAHTRGGGVVHRDIKPSNIILDSSGKAFIMDFGIAKAADSTTGLTMTGMVVGTPEYMSPEQCRGGPLSGSSDQYSLGLVAYAMLAGTPPFVGQYWSVVTRQLSEAPTPLRDLRPDCPPDVASAVARMIEKSARDRFPDVLTAVQAIGGKRTEEHDPARLALRPIVKENSTALSGPVPVAGIAVKGIPEQARPGQTVSLEAIPVDSRGRPLRNRTVSVESSDPEVLEVVSSDSIRTRTVGTANLVFRCGTREVTQSLSVLPAVVERVSIHPPPGTIRVGEGMNLEASVVDGAGVELEDPAVIWASSDPDVVHISKDGVLSARGVGEAVIFATCEGRSSTLRVSIAPGEPETRGAAVEEPLQFEAPLASTGAPAPAPAPSPGPSASGRRQPGPALILGALGAGLVISLLGWSLLRTPSPEPVSSATGAAVEGRAVEGPAVPSAPEPEAVASLALQLDGGPLDTLFQATVGESGELTAEPRDADGRPLADGAVAFRSLVPDILEIDGSGRWVARGPGRAEVEVTSGQARRTVIAQVAAAAPTPEPGPTAPPRRMTALQVRVAGGSAPVQDRTLTVGETASFEAVGIDQQGRPMAGGPPRWTSSQAAVATVDPGTGEVRAVAAGTSTLTARVGGLEASVDLTVDQPRPGVLDLFVEPWASVTIRGGSEEVSAAEHVRGTFDLPPGSYELILEHPTFGTVRESFRIRSGQTTTLEKDLRSGGDGT